jgi:glycosyltransferase involved in cell wall biosynthesis
MRWIFRMSLAGSRILSPAFHQQRHAARTARSMTPITILIPCYNGASTLGRALESCLIQPEAAQILVVDDGSTDHSVDIANQFSRHDSRVSLLRMPQNGGPARARNWGALNASHGLLAFLDADDEYLPGALTAASAFIADNPAAVSVRLDVDYVDFPVELTAHPDFAAHAATLSNTVPSSLIIRRAAFAALGGFPMDDGFRRIGGEDGAFSWTLREIFGNPRLEDAKRVRMHYHAGIHAERYFRIALGLQAPDSADVDEAFRLSRQFLDTARVGFMHLRMAQVS